MWLSYNRRAELAGSRSTGALILRLAYGYEAALDQGQDPLVEVVEVAMQGFAKASEPGAFLVDNFPVLRYVPEWLMSGGGFKAVARKMRRELDEMYDLPFGFVKEQMVSICGFGEHIAYLKPSVCRKRGRRDHHSP